MRELNAGLPRERQIRVLLGDPPVDWHRVRTRDDWNPFFEMRDSYPAALIETEVLAKQRKALVLYGAICTNIQHFPARVLVIQTARSC